MGKHSIEEEKKEKKFLPYVLLIIVLCLIIAAIVFVVIRNKNNNNSDFVSITQSTTVEGEKLVFKSTSSYNRIMEYSFENNILKSVKIYEQFENEDDFKNLKEQYENKENIKILNINEKEKSIEIEKLDFGSDKDKSYEEIYDKYLVQIIGAYQQI